MHTTFSALAFLALSGFVAGLRKVDEQHLDDKDGATLMGDEDKATEMINKLEQAILTRKPDQMKLDGYLDLQFSKPRVRNCEATTAPMGSLYLEGWVCFLQPLGLESEEANSLMRMLGALDPHQKKRYINKEMLKEAILGVGAPEERDQVLAAVWKKVTGHVADVNDVDVALTKEDLTCKKLGTRQSFLDHIAEQAGLDAGAPVVYSAFEKYYKKLGSKITSHRFFVLMVVNAWHLMDQPYDTVNTANLRVRAVTERDDPNGGRVIALRDDCGTKDGEDGLSKEQIIKLRLEAQEGQAFKFISLSD